MSSPKSEVFESPLSEGNRLHLLRWGDESSPTIVLLHGGGGNAHWWDHLAPRLAVRHHVVALDFRGHGDSSYPEQQIVGAFNDDVEALIDHLGHGDVMLVGHSMGAHVALDHASRHHDTRGAVLIDISRGGGRRSRRIARLALALGRSHASREEAIARFRFLPPSPHDDASIEPLRRAIAAHSVRELPDGRFGFKFDPRWFGLPPRPRPDLSRVACPVLVLRGEHSGLLSPEGAAELVAELPDAEWREIAGAGHHVQIDRPGEVVDAIEKFSDRIFMRGHTPTAVKGNLD